jgi:hypothetical protein
MRYVLIAGPNLARACEELAIILNHTILADEGACIHMCVKCIESSELPVL